MRCRLYLCLRSLWLWPRPTPCTSWTTEMGSSPSVAPAATHLRRRSPHSRRRQPRRPTRGSTPRPTRGPPWSRSARPWAQTFRSPDLEGERKKKGGGRGGEGGEGGITPPPVTVIHVPIPSQVRLPPEGSRGPRLHLREDGSLRPRQVGSQARRRQAVRGMRQRGKEEGRKTDRQ